MKFDWLNEPRIWSETENGLAVTTDMETDFWNRTYYGFIHLNGHFRFVEAHGDFSAEVSFSAHYQELYDQAGLMVYVDNENWLKCGIEYTDGLPHFSVVATRNNFSDWSQLALPLGCERNFRIRITRLKEAIRVQFSTASEPWRMARLAMLEMGDTLRVGMMCCTPKRTGLQVMFENFNLSAPVDRELHV